MSQRKVWLRIGCAAAMLGSFACAGRAAPAECTFKLAAELPVVLRDGRPFLALQIAGVDRTFLLDSGLKDSWLSAAVVSRLNLRERTLPRYLDETSGMTWHQYEVRVGNLRVADHSIRDAGFLVLDARYGAALHGASGLLGQSFLEGFDVEYDLAHRVVRLFENTGCPAENLAYWRSPGEPVTVAATNWVTAQQPYTVT